MLLLVMLLPQGTLLAQKVGETVKNRVLGISFRVPKDWVSIPVDPLDRMTLHKYQASRADQAKKTAGVSMTASLELFFFPISGADTGSEARSTIWHTEDSQVGRVVALPCKREDSPGK